MRAIRLIVCVLPCCGAFAAAPFELPELMSMQAKVERSVVAFEETRHLAVLAIPIVRRGTLRYTRPDRLEMHVVTPFPESTEIVGHRVRVETDERTREWDLAEQPVALAWIEGIRASLAGDAATLNRLFHVGLTGTAASWELTLVPVDSRVAASLQRIEVRGRETQLSTIGILDRQGDRIAIVLTPVARSGP